MQHLSFCHPKRFNYMAWNYTVENELLLIYQKHEIKVYLLNNLPSILNAQKREFCNIIFYLPSKIIIIPMTYVFIALFYHNVNNLFQYWNSPHFPYLATSVGKVLTDSLQKNMFRLVRTSFNWHSIFIFDI